jgi:hypothetical protein
MFPVFTAEATALTFADLIITTYYSLLLQNFELTNVKLLENEGVYIKLGTTERNGAVYFVSKFVVHPFLNGRLRSFQKKKNQRAQGRGAATPAVSVFFNLPPARKMRQFLNMFLAVTFNP